MNYFVTQEQYEQLKKMGNNLEDVETIEEYEKLLEEIGNQPMTNLV